MGSLSQAEKIGKGRRDIYTALEDLIYLLREGVHKNLMPQNMLIKYITAGLVAKIKNYRPFRQISLSIFSALKVPILTENSTIRSISANADLWSFDLMV